MGNGALLQKKVEDEISMESEGNVREDNNFDKYYGIDVIEVSNIALAIKNKEHTINVELSLRCDNLPMAKTFGSTNSMVVIYKSNESLEGEDKNFTEIGRTEIIKSELNPKYIKSFILSFNEEKKEEIEFRIYDVSNPKTDDINEQFLIGTALSKLDVLVES